MILPSIKVNDLTKAIERILLAAGSDCDNAKRVAHALVLSELSGVATHGVHHLPRYVQSIHDGEIVPTAKPEVIHETDNTALVTGNWTFGFVSADFGMKIGIDKARDHQVAIVSVVQVNHIGRVGEYAEMAAEAGMISIIFSSGYGKIVPVAVPYGGSKPLLSTNPISIGVPAGKEPPMVLDFATTTAAQSKVTIALRQGKKLPDGLIIDKLGSPSTKPADLFDGGSLLPFGGHKGSALMLACEMLGRLFSGADAYAEPVRGGDGMRYQGVTFIIFRADLNQNLDEFTGSMNDLQKEVRGIPAAPGFDEVVVPGDLEARARHTGRSEGIQLPDEVWSSLVDVANSLGVFFT